MSISPQLGREHRVEIPAGAISYRDCGNGSPIVFVHRLTPVHNGTVEPPNLLLNRGHATNR